MVCILVYAVIRLDWIRLVDSPIAIAKQQRTARSDVFSVRKIIRLPKSQKEPD